MNRARILWALGLLVVVSLVFIVGIVGSFPGTCAACHEGPGSALDDSAHASTDCYSCHLSNGAWSFAQQKVDEVFVMYPRKLVGSDAPVFTETSRGACLTCHSDILTAVVAAKGLRIKHFVCAVDSSCDRCHATTAHGTSSGRLSSPSMDECVACHSENDASIECATCHEGDTEPQPRPGAWQVTHGKNWQTTHGMGDGQSCSVCHGREFCAKCHGISLPHPSDFGNTHGLSAISNPDACAQCHDRAELCDPCHGMQMPHPDGFVTVHSSEATSLDDVRCSRCHQMTDCETCHANHVHPGGAKPVGKP